MKTERSPINPLIGKWYIAETFVKFDIGWRQYPENGCLQIWHFDKNLTFTNSVKKGGSDACQTRHREEYDKIFTTKYTYYPKTSELYIDMFDEEKEKHELLSLYYTDIYTVVVKSETELWLYHTKGEYSIDDSECELLYKLKAAD